MQLSFSFKMASNIDSTEPIFKKPRIFQHKIEDPTTESNDLTELQREFSRDDISKLNIDHAKLGDVIGLDSDNPFNYMSQSEIFKEYQAQKLIRQEELKLLSHSTKDEKKSDVESTSKEISNEELALIELQKASLEMNTLIELTSLLNGSTHFSLVTSFEANYDTDRQPLLPPLQKIDIVNNYYKESSDILEMGYKNLLRSNSKKRKNLLILSELKKHNWNVFPISRAKKVENNFSPYETMKDFLVVDCSYYPSATHSAQKSKIKSYIPLAFSSSGLIIQDSSKKNEENSDNLCGTHKTIEISIIDLKSNEILVNQNAWDYFENKNSENNSSEVEISAHTKKLSTVLKEKRHEAFAILIFEKLMQECLSNSSKLYSNLFTDSTKMNNIIEQINQEEIALEKNDLFFDENNEMNELKLLFNFVSSLDSVDLDFNEQIYQTIKVLQYTKNSIKLLISASTILSIDLIQIKSRNKIHNGFLSSPIKSTMFSNVINFFFELSKKEIDYNLVSQSSDFSASVENKANNLSDSSTSLLISKFLASFQFQLLRSRLHFSLLLFKTKIKTWCQLPEDSFEITYKRVENEPESQDQENNKLGNEIVLIEDNNSYFLEDLNLLVSDLFSKFFSFIYIIKFKKLNFNIMITYSKNNLIQIQYNNINTISSSMFQSDLSSSAVLFNKHELFNNIRSLLLKIYLISIQYIIYKDLLTWCSPRNLFCKLANSFLTFNIYNSIVPSTNAHIATFVGFVARIQVPNSSEVREKLVFEVRLLTDDAKDKVKNMLNKFVLTDNIQSIVLGQTTLQNKNTSQKHFFISI